MNNATHILVANKVLMCCAELGDLVVDMGNTMPHDQMIGLHNPKWAEPGVMQLLWRDVL